MNDSAQWLAAGGTAPNAERGMLVVCWAPSIRPCLARVYYRVRVECGGAGCFQGVPGLVEYWVSRGWGVAVLGGFD